MVQPDFFAEVFTRHVKCVPAARRHSRGLAAASVIGDDQIAQLAEKAGTSKEQVSGSLAKLFPEIVDKLTPNGTLA